MSDITQATPTEEIAWRLRFIALRIDAGRYLSSQEAANDMLDVVLSQHPEHRQQLLDAIDARPLP